VTPIARRLPSAGGPRYVREVGLGQSIGIDEFTNVTEAVNMCALTDGSGKRYQRSHSAQMKLMKNATEKN